MPLPILILASAQIVAEVAGTSLWVYVGAAGGTALLGTGAGGIYYYRDRLYHWWHPNAVSELQQDDAINNQSNILQSAKQRLDETEVKFEKALVEKEAILSDMRHDEEKTNEIVNDLESITVVEQPTFELLLKKLTDDRGDTLENILNALEKIRDSLNPEQIKILQSILETSRENQALREINQKQQRIIVKLDKINAMLQQKLTSNSVVKDASNPMFLRN